MDSPSPEFCDYSCPYATMDRTNEMTGACRREIVMYCCKFEKFVKKNDFCIEIKRRMKTNDPEYQRRFDDNHE
jgi:hypothetical protein